MVHSGLKASIPTEGEAIVRDYWSAICDCDWHLVPAPVIERYEDLLIREGLAFWDGVDEDDLERPFAGELGVVAGGSVLRLTSKGEAAYSTPAMGTEPSSGAVNQARSALTGSAQG
jgi:hypothetical protein